MKKVKNIQRPGIYLIYSGFFGLFGVRYIGQAKNPSVRWGQHRRKLLAGEHHNRALQKKFRRRRPKFLLIENCQVWQLDGREGFWRKAIGNIEQKAPVLNLWRWVQCLSPAWEPIDFVIWGAVLGLVFWALAR